MKVLSTKCQQDVGLHPPILHSRAFLVSIKVGHLQLHRSWNQQGCMPLLLSSLLQRFSQRPSGVMCKSTDWEAGQPAWMPALPLPISVPGQVTFLCGHHFSTLHTRTMTPTALHRALVIKCVSPQSQNRTQRVKSSNSVSSCEEPLPGS